MKTKPILILTAIAGVVAAIAFAAEKTHASPHHQMPPEIAAEMKAFHEKALAAYDVDKNGTLDQDESAVLHEHVRSGKFPIPKAVRHHIARALGHGAEGHHGSVPAEILAKYDTNEDGKLDEKEHIPFAVDIASGKIEPPHPRHAAPATEGKKPTPGS